MSDDKLDALIERLNEWADSHETMPDGGTYEHGKDCYTAARAIRQLMGERNAKTQECEAERLKRQQIEHERDVMLEDLGGRLAEREKEIERLRGVELALRQARFTLAFWEARTDHHTAAYVIDLQKMRDEYLRALVDSEIAAIAAGEKP